MTVRVWPVLAPTVVSSRAGIPINRQPRRPPDSLRMPRCTAFMRWSWESVGIAQA